MHSGRWTCHKKKEVTVAQTLADAFVDSFPSVTHALSVEGLF